MNKMLVGWFIGSLIFLLNLFDGVSTFFILGAGNSMELNPIIRFAIEHLGAWFLLPKIAVGLAAGFLVAIGWKRFRAARIGGFIVTSVYGALVLYHVVVLYKFY